MLDDIVAFYWDEFRRSNVGILNLIPWYIKGDTYRFTLGMVINCASGGPRARDRIGFEGRFGVAGWLTGPLSNFKASMLLPLGINIVRLGEKDRYCHFI
ncbi:conserved hypothetical protein [Ricinus communis]|uniref:Uncharacterized protein n=1 Tax=Ricinus communis TaxID=3988 RepID=B9S5E7_RICCO|nr:conserved hypothetical protein [Ricinus communis]